MFKINSALVLAALVSSASLVAVGCSHDKMDNSMNTSSMSADDMIAKGNSEVQMGQRMKDHAAAMKAGDMMDGMSKDDMMMKGDKMMNEGMMMKQKGMDMKAHGA